GPRWPRSTPVARRGRWMPSSTRAWTCSRTATPACPRSSSTCPREPAGRMTLVPDQLRHMAAAFPDEVGFTVLGDEATAGDLTFAEWHGTAARLARGLVANGVEQGDRVALLLAPADALRFVVAYAAAHMAGAVA